MRSHGRGITQPNPSVLVCAIVLESNATRCIGKLQEEERRKQLRENFVASGKAATEGKKRGRGSEAMEEKTMMKMMRRRGVIKTFVSSWRSNFQPLRACGINNGTKNR